MRFTGLALSLFLVHAAHAQVASGTLSGMVVDESSAAVPFASISAKEESTGFTRTTQSGAQGSYVLEELPPGSYSITAQRDGFRETTAEHISVEVNRKTHLDLNLKIGEMRDTVTAVAAASPVQSDEASIGYRLDAATTEGLPLGQRNIAALVTLGPGAIPRQLGGFTHDIINDVQQGSRGSVAFNPPINGSRSTMNAFLLDGAYDTDRNGPSRSPYIRRMVLVKRRSRKSPDLRNHCGHPAEFPQVPDGGGHRNRGPLRQRPDSIAASTGYLRNDSARCPKDFDDAELAAPNPWADNTAIEKVLRSVSYAPSSRKALDCLRLPLMGGLKATEPREPC